MVLADPDGNEFCVIEAGNKFLAGTGFIGALACDGTQEVGYFWSKALRWPLVWDQDQETAIQSPNGGTKITWGGPPVARNGYEQAVFGACTPRRRRSGGRRWTTWSRWRDACRHRRGRQRPASLCSIPTATSSPYWPPNNTVTITGC